MGAILKENGYENDLGKARLRHEIYLSDTGKTGQKMEDYHPPSDQENVDEL